MKITVEVTVPDAKLQELYDSLNEVIQERSPETPGLRSPEDLQAWCKATLVRQLRLMHGEGKRRAAERAARGERINFS